MYPRTQSPSIVGTPLVCVLRLVCASCAHCLSASCNLTHPTCLVPPLMRMGRCLSVSFRLGHVRSAMLTHVSSSGLLTCVPAQSRTQCAGMYVGGRPVCILRTTSRTIPGC